MFSPKKGGYFNDQLIHISLSYDCGMMEFNFIQILFKFYAKYSILVVVPKCIVVRVIFFSFQGPYAV